MMHNGKEIVEVELEVMLLSILEEFKLVITIKIRQAQMQIEELKQAQRARIN